MRLRTLFVVVCLLVGLQVGAAQVSAATLTVTKVVEWNGVEADPLATFQICLTGVDPVVFNECSGQLMDGDSWEVADLDAGDYVITEPDLGPEWDFVVGLPGDDEIFVDDTVTVSGDTAVTVRNSRLLNYAFVAIGNQILRVDLANLIGTGEPVLPDPENPLTPFDTVVAYTAAEGTIFNGLTLAGDGKLYFCGNDGISGFVSRLRDPLFRFTFPALPEDPLPEAADELVFSDSFGNFDPHCGTVDPFGALVVANGHGGVVKFYKEQMNVEGGGLAGMCVFRDVAMDYAELCWDDLTYFSGSLAEFTIPGSDDPAVGVPNDVAYVYDNDLLVRTEVAIGAGAGPPGQQKKQPTIQGALLRVFWPDFDPLFGGGFFSVDPALCNNQNFKYLLSGLELKGNVTVSGNGIFVTNGKKLARVVPPASPVPSCQSPVTTTQTYAEVTGNNQIQVAAGDLDGHVYFGTRGSNSAGLYLADGTSTTPVQQKTFPKNDYAAAIDGLAVTLTLREEPLPATTLVRHKTELDALSFYLTADCGSGASVTEVPAFLGIAQALIDDIPPNYDPNDPDANQNNLAVPNTPPGLDGWQAVIETEGCDLTASEGLIFTEFWYSILLNNRRVTRHDSICAPGALCLSSFETLIANSLFDPEVIFDDPIKSGGGKRSRRQVVGAALDPARQAFFFGYLSPFMNAIDPFGDVYTVTPSTTVPIKFKLEDANHDPVIGAEAMLTIARIANVPPSDPSYPGNPDDMYCPFPEFMQVEPNGAGILGGALGLTPLYEGSQGNGNYSFNQHFDCEGFDSDPDVTSDDWCNGDYRITTTFLTDNLAEQETLLRVSGCP